MTIFIQIKKLGIRFGVFSFRNHNTDVFMFAIKWYSFFDTPFDNRDLYHWFALILRQFTNRRGGGSMTDQKILEAIERIIKNSIKLSSRGMIYDGEIIPLSKEILTAIKQFEPEPLEVEIFSRENIDDRPNRWLVKYKYAVLDYFLTENQAIDFCTLHGLKVINKETIK